MNEVRCTNCGSTALLPDASGEFCKCESCGTLFNVQKAEAFAHIEAERSKDIGLWREYMKKQLAMQEASDKSRDYESVKVFAMKILAVLPDDFCAMWYNALSDLMVENDTAYLDFLKNVQISGVTASELEEVTNSVIKYATPKYRDEVLSFLERAYPNESRPLQQRAQQAIMAYIARRRQTNVLERDVFICHRTVTPDQDIADAICTRLEERGLKCWIAPRNILPGSQNYERDIIKGVESCRILLFVSSFKSIYSEDCEMEIKAAHLADKALYSYRIDDTPYDGMSQKCLSSVQWLDARDDPYGCIEQLIVDIKSLLASDEKEKETLNAEREKMREKERVEAEKKRRAEQERIQQLEELIQSSAITDGSQAPSKVSSKLRRARIELESGNFSKAQDIADELLDFAPENGEAWWICLLATHGYCDDKSLVESGVDYLSDNYYKNAKRFASGEFAQKLSDYESARIQNTYKKADECLKLAQEALVNDDFDTIATQLKACEGIFNNPGSLVYSRFPDLASSYYWLSLWLEYGQRPEVCVEDITREEEYQKALLYATPIQKDKYLRTVETIGRNATEFLRVRSVDERNNRMLIDYLADNKNIIPPDVYRGYASLMYYRKMLSSLNMTEQKLARSSIDLRRNEYFMLAYDMGSKEQKMRYDRILATLDKNRRAEAEVFKNPSAVVTKVATKAAHSTNALLVVNIVLGSILLLMSFASIAYLVEGRDVYFIVAIQVITLIAQCLFLILAIKNKPPAFKNCFGFIPCEVASIINFVVGILSVILYGSTYPIFASQLAIHVVLFWVGLMIAIATLIVFLVRMFRARRKK